ncbi:MAG: choice-of-anchor J domain-containing protein [Candidatus Krumholzibacteriia bacterium]
MRNGLALHALVTALLLAVGAAPSLAHEAFSQNPDPAHGPVPNFPRTDLLQESFEAGVPPTGWAIIQLGSSNTWEATSNYVHSGDFSAYVRYGPQGSPQDEYLVTPALDFSAFASAYLEFYEQQQYWPGYGEHHYIGVSTTSQTDPAEFTMLVDWTPANHAIDGFASDPEVVDLSAYAGEDTVYVCFRYQGTYADNWYIDDVRVYEPFDHDLVLATLAPGDAQFGDGDPLQPQVHVLNRGTNAEDFDLVLQIEESGALVYQETQSLHLEIGEGQDVSFPDFLVAAGNYYRLHAEAQLASEEHPEDNVLDRVCNSYTQRHTPLGWIHTNAGCSYCAPIEYGFDDWLPSQGDSVAMIRCHTWWPNGGDIMYLQNVIQNHTLILDYGADYTPHFWVDGIVDAGYSTNPPDYIEPFDARKAVLSPGLIGLHWRPADSTLVTCLDLIEPLDPAGDYRLQVAVTEDSIYFAGGNGHNVHNQALRRIFPVDLSGLPVQPETGIQTFSTVITPESFWIRRNMNATVFLQDANSRRIWQASGGRLNDLVGQLRIEPSVCSFYPGELCTLQVVIDPSQIPVKGVDVVIDFDESLVELQGIEPGDWIGSSGLTDYFFDYTASDSTVAHFSMAFLDGTRGEVGELARLIFKGVATGVSPLTFTLEKVRDVSNTELGYTTSENDSLIVLMDLTATEEQPEAAPLALRLLGNRPNPFNPSTEIAFTLPQAGLWHVLVYDASGRRVRTLADGWLEAGTQRLRWDGLDDRGASASSGLYLLRVAGPAGQVTGKMVLLK